MNMDRHACVTPRILRAAEAGEFYTDERCFIRELSNGAHDEAASVAQARVAVGVTTRWHRLDGIAERYVIVKGTGRVEVEGMDPHEVGPGDVVLIPPGRAQRIACLGAEELIFLAICTPRFRPEAYRDAEGGR